VQKAFQTLEKKVTGFASDIKTGVQNAFNNLKTLLTGGGEEGENGVAGSIKSGVEGAFDTLKNKVVGFAKDIKNDVDTAFNNLKTAVVGGGGEDSSGGIIGAFVSGVTSPFQTLKRTLLGEGGNPDSSGLVGRITSGIRTAFSNISKFLNSKFDLSGLETAFNNVIDPIETDINNLIEDINKLLGLVDDIEIPDVDIPDRGVTDPVEDDPVEDDPVEDDDNGKYRGGRSLLNDNPVSSLTISQITTFLGKLQANKGNLSSVQRTELTLLLNEADKRDNVSEIRDAGAATGGFVASTGRAIIHEGERVVPEAQITDRGRVEVSSGSSMTIENLTVNADSRSGGRAAGRALKRELKRFDI
jgi:Flp pilus assembly pilin Flp